MAEVVDLSGAVLSWGAATHVGRVRALNEDSHLTRPPVFVVADGMGGHDAGEVASALTVGRFETLCGDGPASIDAVAEELRHINDLLTTARSGGPDGPTMGTTAVGLVLVDHAGSLNWLVFNVGDSRAYRAAAGRMTQLSRDHSHVQDLVDRGEISLADARLHPHRNVVTRALGADPEVEPDYWVRPLQEGERFLLCSDGLTGEVDDATIERVLLSGAGPDEVVGDLVDRALASGGRDNVTAVVVDVVEVPEWSDATTETRKGAPTREHAVVVDLSDGGIHGVPEFAPPSSGPALPRPSDDPTGIIDAVPPTGVRPADTAVPAEAAIDEVPFTAPPRPVAVPPPVPPPIIAMPAELAPSADPHDPRDGATDVRRP